MQNPIRASAPDRVTSALVRAPAMSSGAGGSVFDRLRVRPVINAAGIYTDLGGSRFKADLWSDLTQLNGVFVDLVELLDATGARIANLVHAEAARVVPGASAGIALATAAAMTGLAGAAWEQLPDTDGLRSEILLQAEQASRYLYLNPARLTGARARIVDAGGAPEAALAAAIGPKTAAILVPAHLDRIDGAAPLEAIVPIARAAGVTLIVDAAYQCRPPEQLCRFPEAGADLTVVSAKYFGGPNAGGFVAGRKDLIDAIAGLDFTRFESGPWRTFGRPFKMGRFDIAATLLALEAWFATDHAVRAEGEVVRAAQLQALIGAHAATRLACFTLDARVVDQPVNACLVEVQDPALVAAAMADGTPSIRAVPHPEGLLLVTETLSDEEVPLVAARLLDRLT